MIKKMILAVMAVGIFTTSCSDDDDASDSTTSMLTIDFTGLETLGDDYVYEGWLIVDGEPVTTGRFSSVDFPQNYTVNTEDLENATTFVLSIEPTDDPDPAPAETKLLAGDFSGDSASVSSTGIVADFSTAAGTYILATPTDDDDTNEASGVWFLDNTDANDTTPPVAGLDLPALTEGWVYEGWAVIDGTPVSTGTFTNVAGTDYAAPYSGPIALATPNGADGFFPGEDFLLNAPGDLTFPTDLRDQTIVISVEPSPDNSDMPFTLKPLAHVVPTNAETHTAIMMAEGPIPVLNGTVTR